MRGPMGDHRAAGSSIPALLRELTRWLTWSLTKNGKQPHSARWPRPEEWLSWKEVQDVELTDEQGLGIAFTGGIQLPDNSYLVALDADSCYFDGVLEPWAKKLMVMCRRTYTSISPSKTGLRIWLRLPALPSYIPKLFPKNIDPDEFEKQPNLQLFGYGVAQYCTETGELFPGASTSVKLFPNLDFLIESGLFEEIQDHAANGAKFTLPKGIGDAPSMDEIKTAVETAPKGVDLMNARWAELSYPSASECAWEFSRHVLAAAQNHGEAAVEFITQHTPWGLGHVDALEPHKYMRPSRWAKDLCRAVMKGVAKAEPVKFEPVNGSPTAAKTPKKNNIEPLLVTMTEIEERQINWLWQDRLALGRLSLLSAPPGAGKSYLTCFMAACVTDGSPWPDGASCVEGEVVLVSAEDDPHDTIKPRLRVCGADLRFVHLLAGVRRIDPRTEEETQMAFTLDDLRPLDVALSLKPNTRLVVIDPIGSYFGGKKDSYIDTEVRSVLAPLADLARKHEVAMVLVAHTRKSGGGSADDAVMGSRAFTGLSRSVYHIFRDPENRHRRFLLPGKTNIGEELPGLAFELVGKPMPKVVFDDLPVDMPADELAAKLGGKRKPPIPRNVPGAAEVWLREVLVQRGRPAAEVKKMAEGAGFNWRSVQRAMSALGVVPQKLGFRGPWFWELPNLEAPRESLDLDVEGRHTEPDRESSDAPTPSSLRDLL